MWLTFTKISKHDTFTQSPQIETLDLKLLKSEYLTGITFHIIISLDLGTVYTKSVRIEIIYRLPFVCRKAEMQFATVHMCRQTLNRELVT